MIFFPRRTTRLALLISLAALAAGGCTGTRPDHLGVRDARLTACPPTPNCVCSDDASELHRVAPYRIAGEPADAWRALEETVSQLPRTRVATRSADYLHVEFTSLVFRFVDDVEFHLRAQDRLIAVRSASRVGRSDLGVNGKRVEHIRTLLEQRGVIDEGEP
jgi:uncharacterized protein (DUF1499 family)